MPSGLPLFPNFVLTFLLLFALIRFFADNPTYQSYFSFRNVQGWEALSGDKRLKAHAANVVYTLAMMIDNLTDGEVFTEMVEKLARSHVRRKLDVSHFENLKGSLVKAFITLLGPEVMTEEAIGAWAKAYAVITDTIQKTIDEQPKA